MKVIIKSIKMQNFKGFAMAERNFNPEREIIKAKNGSGKSTFRFAFEWVLGLNVDDVIPMIDNKEIPNLNISVEAFVNIDGCDYAFKRTQKEIYRTNRETGVSVKTNNESAYYIDGIEFTLKNYKEKIAAILGNAYENLEMLICKERFNSDTTKWGWSNRRKVLFDICKVDEVLNMLAEKPEYELIFSEIKKGYSTAEIKKSIAKEKKGYIDEQKKNEAKIEEKISDLTKYSGVDFDTLEKKKQKILTEITKIQTQTKKENVNTALESKNAELSKLVSEVTKLQYAAYQERDTKSKIAASALRELDSIKNQGDLLKQVNLRFVKELSELNNELTETNKKVYSGNDTCSLCKQPLPADMVENAKNDFEKNKKETVKSIKADIAKIQQAIKENEEQTNLLREQYKTKQAEYATLKAEAEKCTEPNDSIKTIQEKITALKNEIAAINTKNVNTETTAQLSALQNELNGINAQLAYKNFIADIKARITALKAENTEYADKIAVCEKKLKALQEFVREQISLVSDTINGKFENGVSFALFNELYKDGDGGTEETCICMYNGKRYSSMSTGERYFADIEVVKTLQREYGVNLPIFCDNAEAITIDLKAEQQLIELYAAKGKNLDGVTPIENIL